MKHLAQAVLVIAAGAIASWLALVIPSIIRYDPTRNNE